MSDPVNYHGSMIAALQVLQAGFLALAGVGAILLAGLAWSIGRHVRRRAREEDWKCQEP